MRTTSAFQPSPSTKAYYTLNGNSFDRSGQTNTGTDTAITYPQGRFGQAAKFNGSSSKIALPTSTAGTFGGSTITISLWVNYLGVIPADFTWLISKYNDGVDFGSWAVWYRTSGTKLVFMTNSNKTNATQALTEKAITIDNKWHNYLFVNNGTNGLIYIDGLLAASGSREDMDSTAQTMTIGASNTGRYSNCLIDEVIIESRAWTAKEVETYYRKSMLNYKQKSFGQMLLSILILDTITTSEVISTLRNRLTTVIDTITTSETVTALKAILVTILDTITTYETVTTVRNMFTSVIDTIVTSEPVVTLSKKWTNITKTISSFINPTKNNATPTNISKTESDWTNKTKS